MSLMAVIIQEQVTGQGIAGVAFTRDPNTGDPEKITIASSYGLGDVCYNHNQLHNIFNLLHNDKNWDILKIQLYNVSIDLMMT